MTLGRTGRIKNRTYRRIIEKSILGGKFINKEQTAWCQLRGYGKQEWMTGET